jgi:hypothetical protein
MRRTKTTARTRRTSGRSHPASRRATRPNPSSYHQSIAESIRSGRPWSSEVFHPAAGYTGMFFADVKPTSDGGFTVSIDPDPENVGAYRAAVKYLGKDWLWHYINNSVRSDIAMAGFSVDRWWTPPTTPEPRVNPSRVSSPARRGIRPNPAKRAAKAPALRSIADVLREDRVWSPAPMAPIHPATRRAMRPEAGILDVVEVARRLRADITAAVRDNRLPPGLKAQVTTSRGTSLRVVVLLPAWMRAWVRRPAEDYARMAHYGIHEVLSPDAESVRERVQWIVNRYQRDDSDLASDLHDRNFYDDVVIAGDRASQERELLMAERAGQPPIDVVLTEDVLYALGIPEQNQSNLAVFATDPGRRWTVAAWEPRARMMYGRGGQRDALHSARRVDVESPEEALDVARDLARRYELTVD